MKRVQAALLALISITSPSLLAQSKSDVPLSPDLAKTYNSKADDLMRVGKIKEASTLYEKAIEMGMTSAKGRADLAKAKLKYPGPSDIDKEEIRKIISATCMAFLKSDVDGILKNYSDQAIAIPSNQVVNAGTGNIKSMLEGSFSFGSFTKFERSLQSIEGTGPIAVAWGKTESTFKASNGKVYEDQVDDIFMFRRQRDGQWKILVHHQFTSKDHASGQPSENMSAIRQVIDKWSFFVKPGEVLGAEHVENLAAIHSAQGIDIRPNQRSFIGMANLRVLWAGFKGIKWAQFTDYNFEVNSLATIGPQGFAQKAVAWGIGDHSNYRQGSDELSQYLFPWAMILTKENDGQWRILVYHFYLG